MSRTKEIVTAVGTLACALGIGFVMQNTDTASQRYGASERPLVPEANRDTQPQVTLPVRPEQEQVTVIDVQDVRLTSALPNVAGVMSDPPEAQQTSKAVPAAPDPITIAKKACDITADASPAPAAQVALEVSAPCHNKARLTVHHNGMFFTERTDAEGQISLTVPALSEQAVYIVAFSDGEGAVAQTRVDDIADYNRVVLQWSGAAGFELHAREFGAEYGSEGHVWAGSADATLARLERGTGGYLTHHGRDDVGEPHSAEIYTFPATMSGRNGQIDLSVEAEITSTNCGLEIEAQTLERDASGVLRSKIVTLAVPGCDAVGDYLVLNNILDDMKVAAR